MLQRDGGARRALPWLNQASVNVASEIFPWAPKVTSYVTGREVPLDTLFGT